MKYEKIHSFIKVSELVKLVKDKKLFLPDHQRNFVNNKKQFEGIVDSIINNEMLNPMVLCDVNSCLELSEFTNNKKDLLYFKNILSMGFVYSLEDGQHRTNYITIAEFILTPEKYQQLLDSELPVVYLKYCNHDKLVRMFQSTNEGKKIKTHEKVWSINNDFNDVVKKLVSDSKLELLAKQKDLVEKTRQSYKFLLKAIKVCAANENMSIAATTGDSALMDFVSKNYDINKFEKSLECVNSMISILLNNNIPNKNEDYVKYNLLFLIHIVRTTNLIVPSNKIEYFISHESVWSNLAVSKRYNEMKRLIMENNDVNVNPPQEVYERIHAQSL